MKHQYAILKSLGISGIYSEVSTWKYTGKEDEDGTQIDISPA
jgi:hypothetical protein